MDLVQYFNVIRRWVWLLILAFILGATAGFIYTRTQTPVYLVSTKIMVGGTQQVGTQLDSISYYSAQQLALTYIELLKTKPLLDSVSTELGYPIDTITAQLLPNTQVIQIDVRDTNPLHAVDIANTSVNVLISQNETLQTGRYSVIESNLQSQVDQVQKQISSLQGDITKISQQSIQDQLDQIKAQIAPLQEESTNLQKDIVALQTQNASFTFPTLIDKQQIAANKALIVEKQNRIAQIQPLINQYQNVYSNLLILGQTATSANSQVSVQLSQLQSTLNVYQQLYVNLLGSLQSVRFARTQNTPTVTQIEPATIPQEPISPRPLRDIAIAGGLGLLSALGAVYLIEYLDDTIKTPEQVEKALGLTIVGYIADVSRSKIDDHGMFVASQPRSPVAEAFRSLRTNIEYSSVDHPIRTLLVTSSGPGEGKSTVSANLAGIIAQNDKRVTLVDADLRRPSIHRFFNSPNRDGLTDVFRDHLELEQVSKVWEIDKNVNYITSGSLPPNPSELVGSEKMSHILESLKQTNSMVIIDSPPSIVADPQLLSTKVDGVLIVIRPMQTQMSALRAIMDQLNRVGANVIGVVFNRIPQNRGRYYGGYKHYSQYYYRNYHYQTEDETSVSNLLAR